MTSPTLCLRSDSTRALGPADLPSDREARDTSSTCATVLSMEVVGLRELRQNASDLVRRVEEGEEIVITVAGRPGARLVPAAPRTWRRWDDVAELFAGPGDPAWSADREELAADIRDPWDNA
jgi:prevent-host-death family protein